MIKCKYGIWRRTITSRDTGEKEFESIKNFQKWKAEEYKFLASIGYTFWFIELYNEEGKRIDYKPEKEGLKVGHRPGRKAKSEIRR